MTVPVFANLPGGGTGTGASVTLTDNGSTATMANGIVSMVITKASASIVTINYTYNNSGSPTTYSVLNGGKDGGEFYWETGGFGTGTFTYSVVANNGNYCEVDLSSASATNGVMDIHFSMLRGSTGFYVTGIWSHHNGDLAMGLGETRDNIYISPTFTWNSIDATRNFQYNTGGAAVGVQGAPVECSLWTNGVAAGRYEDKYKYSVDFGTQRAWGWSSVNNPAAGVTGLNIGIWHVLASAEYYNGGPMKPELMDAPLVNMLNGGHYYLGNDSTWGANETWTRVQGPYFIYLNSVTNTLTNAFQTASALFSDAQAQAVAEQSAWPYYWFTNVSYASAAQRGTVSGQFVIADAGNPNATASNLWVGVVQQPSTTDGIYDFQLWMKPYQFWAHTDTNGNFTIPDVIAGNNYTLYAFGQGANGTFMSQNQNGGSPVLLNNVPASPFGVTVTGGATNNLGPVTWTPGRVGATVFEIGYPDRTARKFRHGEDWWVGDIGPSPTNPMPVWTKFLEYPFDFPNGPNYVVGLGRWSTDWNFIQPVVVDAAGNYNPSTSTIQFNLATAPTNGATASLYVALCSDDAGALIISVNGHNLGSTAGVTSVPAANSSNGYFPPDSVNDTSIREGINAAFSEERLTFPASLLQTNTNTITITMRKGGYFANHAMYDYLRLELTGYVPPPPAGMVAYAGNNANLLCWPVTPGATSYNLLRTTTSGSGYVSITNGVTGPVCGSGLNNATFLDTNAANGTTYYYVVQSVNPTGSSTNSPESPGATPLASLPNSAPSAPSGLTVSGVAHQSVTLNWSAPPGANFYTIYRSTSVDTLGGASNTLRTIVLNNNTTGTSYTDISPTDGSIYSYFVTATDAGGTSGTSAAVVGVPLPAPPATVPAALTGNYSLQNSNVVLNWSSVPGAVGYIIRRATAPGGPFLYLQNISETTYTDGGLTPGSYYYQVTAVNAAGVSSPSAATVIAPPAAPVSLSAIAGDSQVVLTWTPVANATGYFLKQGTSSGNETTTLIANYSGTSYTNTGLADGTTYYYVVTATNAGGLGANSPEASATPNVGIVVAARNLTWKGDGSANVWDVSGTSNWKSNTLVTTFNNGDAVNFDDTGSNNVAVAFTGTLLPALTTVNSTKNYIFGGSGTLGGSNILIKAGTGTLTITEISNTFTGGTILSNGLVLPASAAANISGFGSGGITLYGGTLEFNGYTGNNSSDYLGNTNPLIIPLGANATIHVPQRFLTPGLNGPVSGSGTLQLFVSYVRGDISANWANFFGQLNVQTPGTGDFRIANVNGFPNAKLNVGANVFMYSRATAGAVIPIGEFSAALNVGVAAGGGSSVGVQNAVTWRVGGLNTDTTNGAIFQGTTALIKEGTGAWTLTGASTHTGTTTVSNGTVLINGSFNGSPVTVAGGALGGSGVISGAAVTVKSGGTFAPGPGGAGFGTLTISNNLTLSGGSTTFIQLQDSPVTNTAAKISGTLAISGTLSVTNLGGNLTNGDSFKLFLAPTISGGFTNLLLPPLTGSLLWNTNNLKASGTISVVMLTSPLISGIQLSGTSLILSGTNGVSSWPYVVLATTNLIAAPWTPVATNQFGPSGNFSITNIVDPARAQTFYMLQLQ